MAEREVRIEGSFELLSQDEWDAYLSVGYFERLRIDMDALQVSEGGMPDLKYPRLAEMINEHNNKVGSVSITYALCKHYYDRGIPDDPWCISPGNQGQSVQYMPLFQQEHWMRRYWFNYFADTYYLKLFSIWDSVVEILNHFYGLDYASDLRLRGKVIKWLESNSPRVFSLFEDILSDSTYQNALKYRTAAAHGTSPSTVSNTVKRKNEEVEIVAGVDQSGRPIMKRVKGEVISIEVGEYTHVATIMSNMEAYAVLSGDKIQEVIQLLTKA